MRVPIGSTALPAFGGVGVLDWGRSARCMVISDCDLICISLMTRDIEHLLICLLPAMYVHLYSIPSGSPEMGLRAVRVGPRAALGLEEAVSECFQIHRKGLCRGTVIN